MPHRFTTTISADQLADLIEKQAVAVFDCSFDLARPDAGREGWLAAHIPGAAYLHLDEDLSSPAGAGGRHPLPDPQRLAEKLRGAGLDAGQQAVAYDGSGGPYAARLWWLLRWFGHDAVAVLDGGVQAWSEAGHPLEAGEIETRSGTFAAVAGAREPTVDVSDVLANLASGERLVIDARSPERFAGAPNPLDPVAGHIPGARNRFFQHNLDGAGRFRAADELAADFAAVLGDFMPGDVILQCGSGVTACHNALAMEIAGLPGAALYPGSWSEWIRDPVRPVERS